MMWLVKAAAFLLAVWVVMAIILTVALLVGVKVNEVMERRKSKD